MGGEVVNGHLVRLLAERDPLSEAGIRRRRRSRQGGKRCVSERCCALTSRPNRSGSLCSDKCWCGIPQPCQEICSLYIHVTALPIKALGKDHLSRGKLGKITYKLQKKL